MDEEFLNYSRKLRDKSISYGIPSIDEEEGFILYSIVYTYSLLNSNHLVIVDAGAGIGYSTLWLGKALIDSGCNICLVEAVEKNKAFAEQIPGNVKKHGLEGLPLTIVAGDAVEYVMNKDAESIDILFVDIEKNRYPKILEESYYKMKKKGFIIFHNALFPSPPMRLYELIREYGLKHTIIPTTAGLLVIHKS